jgi:hypothetical protein
VLAGRIRSLVQENHRESAHIGTKYGNKPMRPCESFLKVRWGDEASRRSASQKPNQDRFSTGISAPRIFSWSNFFDDFLASREYSGIRYSAGEYGFGCRFHLIDAGPIFVERFERRAPRRRERKKNVRKNCDRAKQFLLIVSHNRGTEHHTLEP